jgi:hypothetical protein
MHWKTRGAALIGSKISRIYSAINLSLNAILILWYVRNISELGYNFEGFILSVTTCVRYVSSEGKFKEVDLLEFQT